MDLEVQANQQGLPTGKDTLSVPLEERTFEVYSSNVPGWIGWWEPKPDDSHIAFLGKDGSVVWASNPEGKLSSSVPRPPFELSSCIRCGRWQVTCL